MNLLTKKYIVLILKLSISAGLIFWLCSGFAWQDLLQLISRMDPLWLWAALFWIVASVGISAYKWALIFQAMTIRIPLPFLWRSYWAGLFCNNFLPSSIGGDGLRIYLSGIYAGDLPAGTASVVMERLLATLGLSLAALLCYAGFPGRIPYLGLFFGGIALLSSGLIFLIFSPGLLSFLSRRFHRAARFCSFLQAFREHGERLAKNKIVLLQALGWSVVFQFCVVMVNYCIFQALHLEQISFGQVAVLIPATSVAAMLPIGVNGYGTREGAYVALFAYLGVSGPEAMAASISFALLVTAASLYGGWLLLRGKILKGGLAFGEAHCPEGIPVFFGRS